MAAEMVIAGYRALPDKEEDLVTLLREHVPILRSEGLATDRPVTLLRSREDGTYLEIFEWVSPEAIAAAHTNPRILAMWDRFAAACEYVSLAGMKEAAGLFPSFDAIDGLVR